MNLAVHVERNPGGKRSGADGATVRSLTRVGSMVNVQVGTPSECLGAILALVAFLTRMRPAVLFHDVPNREALATDVAFVRSLPCVGPDVNHQFSPPPKRLWAQGAVVGLFGRVDARVCQEVVRGHKRFRAHLTLEWFVPRVSARVRFHVRLPGETLVAHGTLVRPVSAVNLHVAS